MFMRKLAVLVVGILAIAALGFTFPGFAAYQTMAEASDRLISTSDWHWYGINLVAGRACRVTLMVPNNADFDVAVYYDWNGDGYADAWERLALGNRVAGLHESVYFTAPVAGRYHIKVWSHSGRGAFTVKVARWV